MFKNVLFLCLILGSFISCSKNNSENQNPIVEEKAEFQPIHILSQERFVMSGVLPNLIITPPEALSIDFGSLLQNSGISTYTYEISNPSYGSVLKGGKITVDISNLSAPYSAKCYNALSELAAEIPCTSFTLKKGAFARVVVSLNSSTTPGIITEQSLRINNLPIPVKATITAPVNNEVPSLNTISIGTTALSFNDIDPRTISATQIINVQSSQKLKLSTITAPSIGSIGSLGFKIISNTCLPSFRGSCQIGVAFDGSNSTFGASITDTLLINSTSINLSATTMIPPESKLAPIAGISDVVSLGDIYLNETLPTIPSLKFKVLTLSSSYSEAVTGIASSNEAINASQNCPSPMTKSSICEVSASLVPAKLVEGQLLVRVTLQSAIGISKESIITANIKASRNSPVVVPSVACTLSDAISNGVIVSNSNSSVQGNVISGDKSACLLASNACNSGYVLASNKKTCESSEFLGYTQITNVFEAGGNTTSIECAFTDQDGTDRALRNVFGGSFSDGMIIDNPSSCSFSMYDQSNVMYTWQSMPDSDGQNIMCRSFVDNLAFQVNEIDFYILFNGDCNSIVWNSNWDSRSLKEIISITPDVKSADMKEVEKVGNILLSIDQSYNLYKNSLPNDYVSYPIQTRTKIENTKAYSFFRTSSTLFAEGVQNEDGITRLLKYDSSTGEFVATTIPLANCNNQCSVTSIIELKNNELFVTYRDSGTGTGRFVYKTNDGISFQYITENSVNSNSIHEVLEKRSTIETATHMFYLNGNINNTLMRFDKVGGTLIYMNGYNAKELFTLGNKAYLITQDNTLYTLNSNGLATQIGALPAGMSSFTLLKGTNIAYLINNASPPDLYKLDSSNDLISLVTTNFQSVCQAYLGYHTVNPLNDSLIFGCQGSSSAMFFTVAINPDGSQSTILPEWSNLSLTPSYSKIEFDGLRGGKDASLYNGKFYIIASKNGFNRQIIELDANNNATPLVLSGISIFDASLNVSEGSLLFSAYTPEGFMNLDETEIYQYNAL